MRWNKREPVRSSFRILSAAAATFACLAPANAHAEAAAGQPPAGVEANALDAPPSGAAPDASDAEPARPTRRSGFTFGATLGAVVGGAQGYPNELGKIDNSAFYRRASGFGEGGVIWLGGALADWFTFGLGAEMASFSGSGRSSSGGAFVFHLEAFPLFARGGALRDLGVMADFGTGTASIRDDSGDEIAKSGAQSLVGLGAFWEGLRVAGDHLALGPFASFHYANSDALARQIGMVGLRTAFYGGP